jgi:Protein of unknown function (DUF3179)
MSDRMWLRVIGLVLMAAAPLVGQQAHQEGRPPMPFVPLREPHFVPAAKADFLKSEDRVVGVSEKGVSKAYQPSVLAFHHVVQDNLKDLPIIVTWCALCNTPLVYRSEVDGKKLTFERAGNRGNNFFMLDTETGSHWQQIGGDCFEGPMKGKRLTMVPFLYTTWAEWLEQHPETLVLVPEAAYKDGYEFMAKNRVSVVPYGSNKKPDRELVREQDSRLPNYEQVIGIEIRDAHKAYPVSTLRKEPIVNDNVGSTPILLAYALASDTTTAYSRVLGGRTLTFHAAGSGTMLDNETGSTWSNYGECVDGKLKGQKLGRVIPQPGSWFAWAEFHPDTQIYSSAAH